MSNPSKKRKLDQKEHDSTTVPARGLEYFFKRQQEIAGQSTPLAATQQVRDDEALARKLHLEWNAKTGPDTATTQPNAPAPLRQPEPTSVLPDKFNASSDKSGSSKVSTFALSLQSISDSQDTAAATLPLDESPLDFNPSDHIPALKAGWQDGCSSYALLARCFVLVNDTPSRIKIVDTLVNCLRLLIEADPQSLLPAIWLASNAIAPPYESLELGIGPSIISKSLKTVCGLNNSSLKALYNRLGDVGDVAFEARKKAAFTLRRPRPLTIKFVHETLVQIAKARGKGSAEVKQKLVDKLLLAASGGEETRYIVRILCQNLRIGAVKTTILKALSRAFLLSRPPAAVFHIEDPTLVASLSKDSLVALYDKSEESVKATFALRPSYNDLVPALLSCGSSSPSNLAELCGPKTHIPIVAMLGSPTRDLAEVVSKVGSREFAAEWKYDGQRAQVHYSILGDGNEKVTIFSRHLENITAQYPDIVSVVPTMIPTGQAEKTTSFVLEGEIVAVSPTDADTLLPFQTLSSRPRNAVNRNDVNIRVCLFAFDLMFLNDEPLLSRSFRERRQLLRTRLTQIPGRFQWVRNIDAQVDTDGGHLDAVLEFFKEAVSRKCEGLMVKLLDAPPLEVDVKPNPKDAKAQSRRKPLPATYRPDKRVESWLKVKKDYDSSAVDTLDLIPIAGWHGNGRKAKWWSPILLAVRREEDGALEAVCKCMSGFSDKVYMEMREFYDDGEGGEGHSGVDDVEQATEQDEQLPGRKNTLPRRPILVQYSGPEPDVWFNPSEVWEIAFADITSSPTYSAAIGLVDEDRGLSLRFPRYLKKRLDKGLDEASSNTLLASLYLKQVAGEDSGEGD